MKIDGHTRLAAVVANPIKHSISPFIQNFAFEYTGVNGVYVAWEVTSEDLKETIESIRRFNMFGINVSMPYKREVIPYLDEIVPEAQLARAVNTIVYQNGRLIGYNTDGKGFFNSLPSFVIKDKKLTILGAGGAATAIIAYACLNGISEVAVFTRSTSIEKAHKRLEVILQETTIPVTIFPLENQVLLQETVNQSHLLINATGVGMDGVSSPVSEDFTFPPQMIVTDLAYQPLETPFLKLAKKQNVKTVNGLGMLLHQGAEAFKLWTGKEMPIDAIWQQLVSKYQNQE
ncbi:MAG: shikimate dehydrogenase [Streptococcus sp.]|nr:shikimate dehydrogenase [Streptococcus sp.]